MIENAAAILKDIVIPEADHTPSARGKKRVAPFVRCLAVLPAIDLDGQPALNRREVRNIGTDRHLPAKLDAGEAAIAQQTPHQPLDIGAAAPKTPRGVALLTFAHRRPHPPQRFASRHPLPQAGEGKKERPHPSAASSSSSSSPAMIFSAMRPAFARTAASIFAAMSGLVLRNVFAFSRPCPMRCESYENHAPDFSTTPALTPRSMISPILETPSPYMMSNSTILNGGASLFFTTLTRVWLPMTSSRSLIAPMRRMSRRTEA